MLVVLWLPWQRGRCSNINIIIMISNDLQLDSRKSHQILRKRTKTLGMANRFRVRGHNLSPCMLYRVKLTFVKPAFFTWIWLLCINSHCCFPVKSPTYFFITEAPSNPTLNLPFKLNVVNPTLFSFGYDYYALTRMIASQLNHQLICITEASSNPTLNFPFKLNFVKPTLFSFGYDYCYALTRMIASQLISLLKRPLTQLRTSPLNWILLNQLYFHLVLFIMHQLTRLLFS